MGRRGNFCFFVSSKPHSSRKTLPEEPHSSARLMAETAPVRSEPLGIPTCVLDSWELFWHLGERF